MKLFHHGKYIMLTTGFILFLYACRQPVEQSGNIRTIIDSITFMYIPDHRMGISEIKANTRPDDCISLTGETTSPDLKNAIIKTLSNKYNKLIDSIIILPDTLINTKYHGLVTISVASIRKLPAHNAEMVSQSVLGTPVVILKNEGTWSLIQTPDHYIGWAESLSVEPMTVSGIADWKRSDRVITIINSGWIYTSPDESGVTGDFVAGSIFVRKGDNQSYTKVELPDGREGYIRRKSVSDFNIWKETVECSEESIVRSALTFIGLPYLWGGSSTKAVDCSGFSQSVYYLNGVILLRDASLQALHGLNVDITSGYGQLKPGDLLFFGTRESSKLHVTHVAIYIGDSEYINSSGRVMINSLDSTRSSFNRFRANSLLAAKRIIGTFDDPGIVRIKSHPWY
jgi:gamma-D-glutamyl-L-lysine dipeptidyl-peptidase